MTLETLTKRSTKRFFAALALAVVLTPALTFAAERDGPRSFSRLRPYNKGCVSRLRLISSPP
jgi:hypothetical protein